MDVITAAVALIVLNISMSLDPPPVMPLICDAISAGWQITWCNPHGMRVPAAARLAANCYTLFTLLTQNVF